MIAIIHDNDMYLLDKDNNTYYHIKGGDGFKLSEVQTKYKTVYDFPPKSVSISDIKIKSVKGYKLLEKVDNVDVNEIQSLTTKYIEALNQITNNNTKNNDGTFDLFKDETQEEIVQEDKDNKSLFNMLNEKLDKVLKQDTLHSTHSDYSREIKELNRKLDRVLNQNNSKVTVPDYSGELRSLDRKLEEISDLLLNQSNNNQGNYDDKLNSIKRKINELTDEIIGISNSTKSISRSVTSVPSNLGTISKKIDALSQQGVKEEVVVEEKTKEEDIFEIKDDQDTQDMLDKMYKVSQELNLKILEAAKWYQANKPEGEEKEPKGELEEPVLQKSEYKSKTRLIRKGRKI